MIMEYIEDSLDKAFRQFKGARGLVIVPQIIKAVNFMYNKNHVHRDIKPGNILICWVDDQPILKMADVGTMKEDDDLKTFAGTPFYMAPEYWSTPLRYGKEVDMWAVGLVLLQLFTNWDPKMDAAWVDGPLGKYNELGFSAWISEVLTPLIATAVPKVQQLLRGLLCESRHDRWTAARCQEWMEEEDMSLTVSFKEEARSRE
jgi:serine/threonine protein kinase